MPSTTDVKQSSRNYSSIGCRHALLCQSFCCANHTDRLQLMRLASTYQVDDAVIVSDLIPLKDAVQIFRTNRPIIVSAEPIEGARVSCARGDGAEAASQIVDKLASNGRKHFAYLYGRESSWIHKLRKKWSNTAPARHGLTFEAEGHGDYSYDSGFKEASLLRRRSKVDALVCGNGRDGDWCARRGNQSAQPACTGRFGYCWPRRHYDGELGVERPYQPCARSCSLHRRNRATHREARNARRRSSQPLFSNARFGGVQPPTHRKIGETPLRVRHLL